MLLQVLKTHKQGCDVIFHHIPSVLGRTASILVQIPIGENHFMYFPQIKCLTFHLVNFMTVGIKHNFNQNQDEHCLVLALSLSSGNAVWNQYIWTQVYLHLYGPGTNLDFLLGVFFLTNSL